MMTNLRTVVLGTGHFLPPRVVTNDELGPLLNTSDEWIVQRTGIRERRFVEDGTGSGELGFQAAKIAIERAGLEASDIDAIIAATLSPDLFFPGNACLLQERLGCKQIMSLDVRNQCSGFLYGLHVADALIRTGGYKNILLVGAEVQSAGLNFDPSGRDMTVLFGDGAGAVVLGARAVEDEAAPSGLLACKVYADGVGAKDLCTVAPTCARTPRITKEMLDQGLQYPKMNGKLVFQWATEKMPLAAKEVLSLAGLDVQDVRWFVPHQANLRINDYVAKMLGIPAEKCWNNIVRYGNTTAATIPIGLSELYEQDLVRKGDIILSTAFGAGFTWGASLIRV